MLIDIIDSNNTLDVSTYEIESDISLKQDISIVHISDLHSTSYEEPLNIIEKIQELNPDIIVITGDMFDGSVLNIESASNFFHDLDDAMDCDIFYTPGNHETSKKDKYNELKERLKDTEIIILENESITKNINNIPINVIAFDNGYKYNTEKMNRIEDGIDFNNLTLGLCHYPEGFQEFAGNGEYDVIFSGHAHGGQFRIFDRGIYAPNQGFLPKYTSGVHVFSCGNLVVSRGIGNSAFPIRVLNSPELVQVVIKANL